VEEILELIQNIRVYFLS